MYGDMTVTFEVVDVAGFFQYIIGKGDDTELERTVGIDKDALSGFVRQLHPADIRTVPGRLRSDVVMKHTFGRSLIQTDLARLHTVGISLVVTSTQISYIAIRIIHLESKPQACHRFHHGSIGPESHFHLQGSGRV